MRLSRLLLRSLLLTVVSLGISASLASAAHVAPLLPLISNPNHSHENFSPTSFPAGNYSAFSFAFANLSNCTFAPGTNLSFANFTGANLSNANLSGCNLDNASFAGADLTNAILPCMGGTDFRGAILSFSTGGGSGCLGCVESGSNLTDGCTTGPLPSLCLLSTSFRGIVSGVVFADANSNSQLDLGEVGVPGATVFVNAGGPPVNLPTDSRGSFYVSSNTAGPGTVQVTLPVGLVHAGPGSAGFNLATCRGGQGLNFPVISPVTPTIKTTFGRVKALYR